MPSPILSHTCLRSLRKWIRCGRATFGFSLLIVGFPPSGDMSEWRCISQGPVCAPTGPYVVPSLATPMPPAGPEPEPILPCPHQQAHDDRSQVWAALVSTAASSGLIEDVLLGKVAQSTLLDHEVAGPAQGLCRVLMGRPAGYAPGGAGARPSSVPPAALRPEFWRRQCPMTTWDSRCA